MKTLYVVSNLWPMVFQVLDLLEDACESLLDDILAENANISA
jgi:hypothetical protein